ncbi:hypothetical protein [Microcoleus sp. T3_B1]|uniref:hypothetical protein n=1 Tax=Microcoleus sp. T3_B1 TaxID=3055425 RepID=UPI002FCF6329
MVQFSPQSVDFSYETGISIPVGLSDSSIDPDRTFGRSGFAFSPPGIEIPVS